MSTTVVQAPKGESKLSEKTLRILAAHDRQVQLHQQVQTAHQAA